MDTLLSHTPWQEYEIMGAQGWVPCWVKRGGLCCQQPGPKFSKIRGVVAHLSDIDADTIGVLDTYHSKAGRGVAWICSHMGLQCVNYYPVYKAEGTIDNHQLRQHQKASAKLGAEMVPMKAGMSAVLYNMAKSDFTQRANGNGYMLPNGLKLQESVNSTADEVVYNTPRCLNDGTWIISISSATIAAGVITGLNRMGWLDNIRIVLHLGYSRSHSQIQSYVKSMAGVWPVNISLIDEGYAYKDSVDNRGIPFPCNRYYDAKAFNWLRENIDNLAQPITFWNIGA